LEGKEEILFFWEGFLRAVKNFCLICGLVWRKKGLHKRVVCFIIELSNGCAVSWCLPDMVHIFTFLNITFFRRIL
jgi:hypothetical protein